MPSPFPGMDPYLEGYLWSDLHSRLATQISDELAPMLEPRYVARLATRMVTGYLEPGEIAVFYPDVEVVRPANQPSRVAETPHPVTTPTTDPPALVLPVPFPTEVPVTTVEIRDAAGNTLVTAIEILSPVNKREPGLTEYVRKRETVMAGSAHLLEIDLLRRGKRPVPASDLPDAPYFVFLTRATHPFRLEVWPIHLQDRLPVLPVPLRPPDPDLALDLTVSLNTVYDRARYHLSIDYHRDPDPPLDEPERAWAESRLKSLGRR